MALAMHPSRDQQPREDEPYDRWITESGVVTAEFHRDGDSGFLLRFPDHADFQLDAETQAIACHPAPGASADHIAHLYANSVLPLIGNHRGELNLHGSAVLCHGKAVAFLGRSGRGKTTLAGAFARAGQPFLAEDMVALRREGSGYVVTPSQPVLRLFPDSAAHLLGDEMSGDLDDKRIVFADEQLPHVVATQDLSAVFVLGSGNSEGIALGPLARAQAMAEIIQHAFILDVEDRPRLAAQFARIGALAEGVSALSLDFPRRFDELPRVVETVSAMVRRLA